MKLSRFINEHLQEILEEWDLFARTLIPAATTMTDLALRNHAAQILQEVARDLETAQSQFEQSEKSKGRKLSSLTSPASGHGTLRHHSGFTLIQLIAEFRALRASVIQLWQPHIEQIDATSLYDMVRFNEAIDQAIAESVVMFSQETMRTQDMFLGILGHDLRTPLGALAMTGDYLVMNNAGGTRTVEVGTRIQRLTTTMAVMVNDLLAYARVRLGNGIPIVREKKDLKDICETSLHDVAIAYPDCQFDLSVSGELTGMFDGARLQQVVTNLLTNAVQYRARNHPVTILASEDANGLFIQVKNIGPVIPPESREAIFNPLVQLSGDGQQENRPATSLGLGLYIARQITEAHGGKLTVDSEEGSGTVFAVYLPRA
jgi:signal transduction histidine kinase